MTISVKYKTFDAQVSTADSGMGQEGSLQLFKITLPAVPNNNTYFPIYTYSGPGKIQWQMGMMYSTAADAALVMTNYSFTVDATGKILQMKSNGGAVLAAGAAYLNAFIFVSNLVSPS